MSLKRIANNDTAPLCSGEHTTNTMNQSARPRIMIVEDEVIISTDLKYELESLGYEVCAVVSSAERALKLLEEIHPDLIAMDIVLQGRMDGIEASEIIREQYGIPVVFMTAYADAERLKRAKLTYPFGYILKPISTRDLKITLDMAWYVAKVDEERRKIEEDLKKYKQIIASTQDRVAYIDTEYRYRIVNEAYERYIGHNKETLIGMTVAEYMGAEVFAEKIKKNFDKCLEGQTVNYQAWFEYPELGRRFIDVTYYPYIDTTGKINGVVANLRDITERHLAEEALRETEARLSAVVEGINAGTWIWNIQTGETLFNERWAELAGYKLEELEPVSVQTWLDLVHPDDLVQLREPLLQTLMGQRSHFDIECRIKHRDDHWVWIQDRGKVIEWSPDGQPVRMAGTHTDITERKLIKEKNLELLSQLIQAPK